MRCRVVTWNIHSCVGSDRRYDVARVLNVLAEIDADIIGLQEVDWRRASHKNMDPFTFFAAELGMNAVDGPNLQDHRGHYGNGLLTRFEVVEVRRIPLEYRGREPRGAIDALLDSEGFRIKALVTHLGLKLRERRAQVRTLRQDLASGAPADATVLLGDMNEWVSSKLMRRAFTPSPFAWMTAERSFPSRWPVFPLDCVFADPRPTHGASRVFDTPEARAASDHLPIVADLHWA